MSFVAKAEKLFFDTGSPVSWLSATQYKKLPRREKLIAWADSQVGALEPSGNNRGPDVDIYIRTAGLNPIGNHFAWCACLIYWCALKAGYKPEELPRIGDCAAVRNWVKWAHNNDRLVSLPDRGYLIGWLNSNATGHIAVALGKYTLGVARTIEGNTDKDGGRDGNKCHKRVRTALSMRKRFRQFYIRMPD